MHHPRTTTDARCLRLASLLLLANRLLIISAIGLLLLAVFANDQHLLLYGSILVASGFLLTIAQWIAASRAGCPLCRTPVLAPMQCMTHRKARRMLGSYKLRVALAIMFTERFRCPYCNEPTGMEVKEKIRGTRGARTTKFTGFY